MPSITIHPPWPGLQESTPLTIDLGVDRVTLRDIITAVLSRGPRQMAPFHQQESTFDLERALRAVANGTLIVVVDGRQVSSPDDVVQIDGNAAVSFIRLVPLAGG